MAYGSNVNITKATSDTSPVEGNNGSGGGNNEPGKGDFEVGGVADLEIAQGNRPDPLIITNKILNSLPIINESQININREVYAKRGFNDAIGVEFEELLRKADTFTVEQFFKLYDSLFFDIPALGNSSHQELKKRSSEFLGESSNNDNEFTAGLLDKITDLEQQLLLANQVNPEHPFYKNGTLIKQLDSSRVYYMDKGFKRTVNSADSEWYNSLRDLLGVEGTPLQAPEESLAQIPSATGNPGNLNRANQHRQTVVRESQLVFADEVDEVIEDITILANVRARNAILEQFIGEVATNQLASNIYSSLEDTLNDNFENSNFPTVVSIAQKNVIANFLNENVLPEFLGNLTNIVTNTLTLPE
jgi:hypothetical protein